MLLRSQHLTLRSHVAPRRGRVWRGALALGAISLVFFGGIKLVPHIHFGTPIPQSTLLVQDAYSGVPVPGAQVTLVSLVCPGGACTPAETTAQGPVGHRFDANVQGQVRVRLPGDKIAVFVSQQGYDARQTELSWPPAAPMSLTLRPTWLTGRVMLLGKPLAGAKLAVMPTPTSEPTVTTTTDNDGKYRFTDVPEGASLLVDAPGVSRRPRLIGRQTTFDLALRPDVLTGTVRDPNGQPVPNLTVVSGTLSAQTKTDGTFTLNGIDDGATLVVKGVGYMPQEVPLSGGALTQEITVRPFVAKGIYVQAPIAAKPATLDRLIAQLNASDMNTMVIDLKDNNGIVYYDSKVPLAREVGAVQPILDVPQLMKRLHERGIYAIARIVVMEDPIAGVQRPDLAIHDTRNGKPWHTTSGQTWLNPTEPKVWQYVSDLAAEAATLGFDEVQFDYVRFPTDGNLDVADFGPKFTGGPIERREAIKGLLSAAHMRLLPTKTLLGADVFGITGWIKNDNGIGQQFEDLAALLDVICPMDYPSHYNKGFNGWDYPNNFPYEVIKQGIRVREARVPEVHRKTRPWLQAFTYGPGQAYGTAEVYAQIQACNEAQTTGYLLWNIGSDYPQDWLPPKPPVATKPTP